MPADIEPAKRINRDSSCNRRRIRLLIVKKFGGTSVANKERIFNVAQRCIEDYQKGNDVVVVLSAMGKSTDELLKKMDNDLKERSKVIGDYERTNVWKFNPETRSKHPAPFPEVLSDNLVKYYTFDGDTVIDPFMGSGTTGVSCIRFNRNFIGCEKDETYFNMAKERLNGISTVQ